MYKVFFDSNAGTVELGFVLWFSQSKHDLAQIKDEPHDGLHVLLYMPEEIEIEAVLHFDRELKCWRGIPIAGKIQSLNNVPM